MARPFLTSQSPSITQYVGRKWNKLTAIRFLRMEPRRSAQIWEFECDCGNFTTGELGQVKNGHKMSCGCHALSVRTKHGFCRFAKNDSFYKVWTGIFTRCYNTRAKEYARYGGRGIRVCERWNKFENFKEDMFPRPDGMTLERKDNDGPYSPENCKWATRKEQSHNRRTNKNFTFVGITQCLSEWARIVGIGESGLAKRLKRGWSLERALTTPSHPTR